MQVIGWTGSILFALSGIPQAWTSYRQGHSRGLSPLFLGLWLAGEVLTLAYILPKLDWPLLFNYGFNLSCLIVILKYKIRERV